MSLVLKFFFLQNYNQNWGMSDKLKLKLKSQTKQKKNANIEMKRYKKRLMFAAVPTKSLPSNTQMHSTVWK